MNSILKKLGSKQITLSYMFPQEDNLIRDHKLYSPKRS